MRQDVQILETLFAMQRHSDFVRRGYHWWTGGIIEVGKALRLQRRFEALYEVNLHRNVRARQRKRGVGVPLLLFYRLPMVMSVGNQTGPEEHLPRIGWTLLVSDGECTARHREVLRDALDPASRLTIGPYELVRLSRSGQLAPAWSYRMSRAYCEAWRERVIRSARGDPAEVPHLVLGALYREPGFAGVRSQVGHVCALYRREWRRRRGGQQPFPGLPRLRYVQRLPYRAESFRG
jgi:hypothetical protein